MSRLPAKAEHRLLLLRHAKSSWDDPRLDDYERPLDRRGQRAGRLLAEHFAKAPPPDLVLCSSSLRTRQTLEHLLPTFAAAPRILIEDGLYLAGLETLARRIATVADNVAALLVIAHNPGLQELAVALAQAAPRRERERLAGKFPTGALACFTLAGPWRGLGHAQVILTRYVTPADLSAGAESDD